MIKRIVWLALLGMVSTRVAFAQSVVTAERSRLGVIESSQAPRQRPWTAGGWSKQWAQRQLLDAVAEARTMIAERDTALRDRLIGLSPRLSALDSAQIGVSPNGDDLLVSSYLDDPDRPGRFTELRLRYRPTRLSDAPITLAVAVQGCDAACEREQEDVLLWTRVDSLRWRLSALVSTDGQALRSMSLVDADPAETAMTASGPRLTVSVTGVVRDERGRALADVEVFSTGHVAPVRTDSTGRYRLTTVRRGGDIVGVRRLGVLPAYRVLTAADTGVVQWSPQLRSAQVLATRITRASRAPKELQARRYEDFLARQERGRGQFLVGEEISRSISLGDALNRLNGINALMGAGYAVRKVRVTRCAGKDSLVGVFVDGVDRTWAARSGFDARSLQGLRAEDVLTELHPASIVALEFYRRSEMPPEYAGVGYCAVVGLWTR
ncbi:MAG: carboxypeptidase-like regulatory domain-containing protein [Gemmatimonadaceae bacterium]|nr:carboxypeptidase-like regulatory domain-containing protein [Gemmatimonadaceae bacterium]